MHIQMHHLLRIIEQEIKFAPSVDWSLETGMNGSKLSAIICNKKQKQN